MHRLSAVAQARHAGLSMVATALPAVLVLAPPLAAEPWSFGGSLGVESLRYPDPGPNGGRAVDWLTLGLTADAGLAPGLALSLDIETWRDHARSRIRVDAQEATLIWSNEVLEAKLGYDVESWSILEAAELNNVLNQTNFERDILGSSRLGQPMLRLSLLTEAGWFGAYYLPQSPERRFDPVFGLDGIELLYETVREDREPGFAGRYQHGIGAVDLQVFFFRGLDNSPAPVIYEGAPRLLYPVIDMAGASAQWLTGSTYLRAELQSVGGRPDISGRKRDSLSWGLEIEHELYGVFGMDADLSLLAAYTANSLGRDSTEPLQDDLSLGAQLTWNSVASTEISILATQDQTWGSIFGTLSFSTRLRDDMNLEIEATDFLDVDPRDVLAPLQDAGHVRVSLTYFF
jgi:hypothetical protein